VKTPQPEPKIFISLLGAYRRGKQPFGVSGMELECVGE